MVCPKCQSDSVAVVPAEIRLYRNCHRTLSHPPLSPSPDIRICLDCGWSEFVVPEAWLAKGWLRSIYLSDPSIAVSVVAENMALLAS